VDALGIVCLGAQLSDADVKRFWEQFVPLVSGEVRRDLNNLPGVVKAVNERFAPRERRVMYRLLNRFALILVARLEPLYLHRGSKPEIPVRSYFHLWMLAHHIICTSKEAYLAAVEYPRSVIDVVPELTNHTGLFALSVFRYEEAIFEAQKLRLIEAFQYPHDPAQKAKNAEIMRTEDTSSLPPVEQMFIRVAQRVSGFFNVLATLRECFKTAEFNHGYPELYPTFRELETGEVIVERYGEITPDTALASDLKSLPG
jgi:hypothetical protein